MSIEQKIEDIKKATASYLTSDGTTREPMFIMVALEWECYTKEWHAIVLIDDIDLTLPPEQDTKYRPDYVLIEHPDKKMLLGIGVEVDDALDDLKSLLEELK